MRAFMMILVALGTCAAVTQADPNDLSGGAFIAHYEAAIQYTDAGFSGCEEYKTSHSIEDCASQVNQMSVEGGVWFVLATWTANKTWAGVQFGIDYTVDGTYIIDYGVCGTGEVLEVPSGEWPSPQTGISLAATTESWTGNFEPVYWFYNYAYGVENDLVAIIPDPFGQSGSGFAGCANESQVEYEFDEENLGGMGLGTEGIYVCPEESAIGACCLPGGGCQLLTQGECAAAGGDFQGAEIPCSPNPCPVTWACCYNGDCFMVTQEDCEDVFGAVWYEWENCATFSCPATSACCFGQTCYLLPETECLDLGGEWIPGSVNCIPNPCGGTSPANDTSWGSIKAMYR